MKKIQKTLELMVAEKRSYFRQWTFDEPVLVSSKHHDQNKKMHKIFSLLAKHFVEHYSEYQHLMPIDDSVAEILELYSGRPYTGGTFRTDFIYDEFDQMKLLEITSRFAFNGYFQQAIFEQISKDFLFDLGYTGSTIQPYYEIFDYLAPRMDFDNLIVLQGKDQKNESKLISPFLKAVGINVLKVPYEEASSVKSHIHDSIILSELGLDELIAMDRATLSEMIRYNFWNDLRTVFLLHDKRFFSVLYNESFRKDVLSAEENDFIKPYLLPSFNFSMDSDIWNEAKNNPESWIIKNTSLGKSQGIFAGPLVSKDEWLNLFESKEIEKMVLQKWTPSNKVTGSIGNKRYEDYLTGTLLFLDNQYFGMGEFRTSSYPITNKVDHRKAFSVTFDEVVEPDFPYLKFI